MHKDDLLDEPSWVLMDGPWIEKVCDSKGEAEREHRRHVYGYVPSHRWHIAQLSDEQIRRAFGIIEQEVIGGGIEQMREARDAGVI
jgi:hypothetical protein